MSDELIRAVLRVTETLSSQYIRRLDEIVSRLNSIDLRICRIEDFLKLAETKKLPKFADLNLSIRARKVLVRMDCNSVASLLTKTSDDILDQRNAGTTTLHEIRTKLSGFGLYLRGEEQP